MWHAGTDILRSKSLDRNSYDSGDWFNFLDFTMTDNGFGAGLPPAADNARQVAVHASAPGQARRSSPTPADMRRAHAQALDLLRLRASTRLFRLGDADQVRAKVSFPVSGTWRQVPGVILMVLDDTVGDPVDERWQADRRGLQRHGLAVRQHAETLRRRRLGAAPGAGPGGGRHREARRAFDDGVFIVPARTVAVFVDPR